MMLYSSICATRKFCVETDNCPTPILMAFNWGHLCSYTLTPVNSLQVSIMQSDNCN